MGITRQLRTQMTKSPLSDVGGGTAYIDWTVDKVSFVIFVMTQSDRLSGFLSILTLQGFHDYVHQAQVSRTEFQIEAHPR